MYTTEEEQVENLKKWLKEYGGSILLGIVIALALAYGWQYWTKIKTERKQQASIIFEAMMANQDANRQALAAAEAKRLVDGYKYTPYASLAALLLAKQAIAKADYAQASKQLDWVIKSTKQPNLKALARLRLARILIQQDKLDQAVNLLKSINNKTYNATRYELLGNTYLKQKNNVLAHQAYGKALENLPSNSAARALLNLKYHQYVGDKPSS